MITILVAHDRNRLIGRSGTNSLPWHIPEDLKLFKQRTLNHSVIMGMKTYLSLSKRPLPNRRNIVVSRSLFSNCLESIDNDGNKFESGCSAIKCGSLECAISVAKSFRKEKGEIFIIGGAEIYKYALENNLVDKIIVTLVYECYQGDIFFPNLGNEWACEVEQINDDFEILIYTKSISNSECVPSLTEVEKSPFGWPL